MSVIPCQTLVDFRDVKMKNVLELNSYVCVLITLMQRRIHCLKYAVEYMQRIIDLSQFKNNICFKFLYLRVMPPFIAKIDMIEASVATTCINTMEMNIDSKNHLKGILEEG